MCTTLWDPLYLEPLKSNILMYNNVLLTAIMAGSTHLTKHVSYLPGFLMCPSPIEFIPHFSGPSVVPFRQADWQAN